MYARLALLMLASSVCVAAPPTPPRRGVSLACAGSIATGMTVIREER
jgi:hypothetical protein